MWLDYTYELHQAHHMCIYRIDNGLTADERLDSEILQATIQSRLQAHRFGDHLKPLEKLME